VYAWQETIVDNTGRVLGNARVEVRDATTLELVPIYSDRDGIQQRANPFRSRAGFAQFWVAAAGRYQITAIDGTDERVWEDVRLGFNLGDIPDLTPVLTPIVSAILDPILDDVVAQVAAAPDLASFTVLGTGAGIGLPDGWTSERLGAGSYRVNFPAGFDQYAVKLQIWDPGTNRVYRAMLQTKALSSFRYGVNSIFDEASASDARVDIEVTYFAETAVPARFVAIASDTAVANIMISDDGIAWTIVSNPVSAGIFQNLAYSPTLDRVVSVPNGGSTTPIYSDDKGATWQAGTPATGIDADDVAWGGSQFVCNTTGGSNGAHRSTDGIDWGASINTVFSASPSALVYAEDLGNFYMGYTGLLSIVRSATGASWTTHVNGTAVTIEFRALIRVQAHGLFVVVDASGDIQTSADGITWALRQATAGGTSAGLAYSPELDVAVSVTNNGRIYRSGVGDLTTWGLQASSQGTLQSVCWSAVAGLFVAVRSTGTGQRVLTSPDGITWTPRNTPADLVWTKVIAIDPT
jgi:hypothetical protein